MGQGIRYSSTITTGALAPAITQHIRDKELMHKFVEFFNVGTIVSDGPFKVQFRIRRFADFERSLFALLDEYPLMTQAKKKIFFLCV